MSYSFHEIHFNMALKDQQYSVDLKQQYSCFIKTTLVIDSFSHAWQPLTATFSKESLSKYMNVFVWVNKKWEFIASQKSH